MKLTQIALAGTITALAGAATAQEVKDLKAGKIDVHLGGVVQRVPSKTRQQLKEEEDATRALRTGTSCLSYP